MQNSATFLKSSFNLNGTFFQMVHLQPNFRKTPFLIQYEITGSDGLIHEGELKITESNSKKQIISFECKLDETYFCKVTGIYSKQGNQVIRLFYKVQNEVDDVIVASEIQKYGVQKVNNDKSEFTEEEPEDDEDDEDDDKEISLEMRVEQLKKISNYFSDEE